MDSKILRPSMKLVAKLATHCVLPKMQYVSGRVAKLLGILMGCPEVSAETSEAECGAHNRSTVVASKRQSAKIGQSHSEGHSF
jgi:hypothetical protein